MNEIKRQLNQKMGDTSDRSASVIQKIEARKKMKRTAKVSKSSGPVYIAIASFVTVLALFFLLGPWSGDRELNANDPSLTPPTITDPNDDPAQEEPKELSYKETLRKFFKQDGDIAYFHGSGNEYASFTEHTTWLSDDYVQIITDNGGNKAQSLYRITDTSIELLLSEYAEEGFTKPTLEELDQLYAIEYILQAPFENNKEFDGKTMYTNVKIKTPFGEVNSIMTEHNENPIKLYFAEGLGLVAEIYEMSDGYVIERYITSINEPPVANNNLEVEVYNETTTMTDRYNIKDLPFIDPYLFETKPDYYAMTYRMLIETDTKELGVLTYACNDKEQCSHVFVKKEREKLSIIAHAWHSYGNVQLSPNHEFAAIPINATEQDGASIIERNQILLIDLSTFEQINPETHIEYFESPTYPIVSFKLTNTSVTLIVGDVASYHHADIAKWQKQSPQKTKEITVPISK